jgi:hypothetical protein
MLVITIGLKMVVFCACGLILLFSAVLYLVKRCAEFYSRLVINKIPNKWRSVENDKCEERDLCI